MSKAQRIHGSPCVRSRAVDRAFHVHDHTGGLFISLTRAPWESRGNLFTVKPMILQPPAVVPRKALQNHPSLHYNPLFLIHACRTCVCYVDNPRWWTDSTVFLLCWKSSWQSRPGAFAFWADLMAPCAAQHSASGRAKTHNSHSDDLGWLEYCDNCFNPLTVTRFTLFKTYMEVFYFLPSCSVWGPQGFL